MARLFEISTLCPGNNCVLQLTDKLDNIFSHEQRKLGAVSRIGCNVKELSVYGRNIISFEPGGNRQDPHTCVMIRVLLVVGNHGSNVKQMFFRVESQLLYVKRC